MSVWPGREHALNNQLTAHGEQYEKLAVERDNAMQRNVELVRERDEFSKHRDELIDEVAELKGNTP